jgi:hypothetical protein
MSGARQNRLIVTLSVMSAIGHNFHGIWRHPRSRNREFASLDLWVELAKKAEATKIDATRRLPTAACTAGKRPRA